MAAALKKMAKKAGGGGPPAVPRFLHGEWTFGQKTSKLRIIADEPRLLLDDKKALIVWYVPHAHTTKQQQQQRQPNTSLLSLSLSFSLSLYLLLNVMQPGTSTSSWWKEASTDANDRR
jgi:hypothetical protein